MTREVLAHGDEQRAGPGRALGVAVTLVLVVMAGVAVLRSAGEQPGEPPAPPPATRPGPFPTARPAPDRGPFAEFVTLRRPPPGVLRTVLLARGLPGFLVPGEPGDLPAAFAAAGGPEGRPVLVGWCAATELFQDEAGQYFYDRAGRPLHDGGPPMQGYAVRLHPGDPARIDVAAGEEPRESGPADRATRKCPHELYRPALPARAGGVHDTLRGFRVVTGRYVVRTETRAFCQVGRDCQADGWEVYGLGALPRGDLAGGYVYEGDFVVRGGTDGSLTAIALPGVRLVRRERVGHTVRVGLPHGTSRADGRLYLDFNPFEHLSGDPPDDSPARPGDTTPRQAASEWSWLMKDTRHGHVGYPVRHDAEIVLGPGLTGLGRPRATPATLERFLRLAGNLRIALWVVLDDRGRVLRVVVEDS